MSPVIRFRTAVNSLLLFGARTAVLIRRKTAPAQTLERHSDENAESEFGAAVSAQREAQLETSSQLAFTRSLAALCKVCPRTPNGALVSQASRFLAQESVAAKVTIK